MGCRYEIKIGKCGLKGCSAYKHTCDTRDFCKCWEPPTNADRIRDSGIEAMAEYGVHGYIPAGCVTPAWYGHFKGYADTKEDAIQREVDWLQQPAPEEGEQNV